VVLIGTLDNEYFVDLIWVSISPFDKLYLDSSAINTFGLDKQTNENFSKSGYNVKSSFIVLLVQLTKFGLGYLILLGIYSSISGMKVFKEKI